NPPSRPMQPSGLSSGHAEDLRFGSAAYEEFLQYRPPASKSAGLIGVARLLFEMVQVEFGGGLVGQVNHTRGGNADRDNNGIADLVPGQAELKGLLDMTLQTTFTLGDQRTADGDQLLRLKIERG